MNIIAQKNFGPDQIVIRDPERSDAVAMCQYINQLSQERTFIRFQGEPITLEEEQAFLDSQLQKMHDRRSLLLLCFANQTLIGIAQVDLKDKVESHEGVLGISIAAGYRGRGIGSFFLEQVLAEATSHLDGLRLITLGVFAPNQAAIEMYTNFGFQEYGRLPGGIRYKGQYVDQVYMYKEVFEARVRPPGVAPTG